MTTTPSDPLPDPDVVPSGDPDPIPTEPLPEQTPPGEEPDINPPHDPLPEGSGRRMRARASG